MDTCNIVLLTAVIICSWIVTSRQIPVGFEGESLCLETRKKYSKFNVIIVTVCLNAALATVIVTRNLLLILHLLSPTVMLYSDLSFQSSKHGFPLIVLNGILFL